MFRGRLGFIMCSLLAGACSLDVPPPPDPVVYDAGSSDAGRPGVDSGSLDSSPDIDLMPPASGPIINQRGPVMLGIPKVYFVLYGDWQGSFAPQILQDLVVGFGTSDYGAIIHEYYQYPSNPTDGGVEYVTGQLQFAGVTAVGYPYGKQLGAGAVGNLVASLLKGGGLPVDDSALYVVLGSADVSETMDGYSSFCNTYCGYHNFVMGTSVTDTYKYVYVGDPTLCNNGCSLQPILTKDGRTSSPNGSWSADLMASPLVHEISEALTDPLFGLKPAWADEYGYENGDMCAWRFNPTYITSNGGVANTRFGTRDFLVQQMWVPTPGSEGCRLHL